MSMHSGDIRDQSRKLLEIALNFGRFFRSPKFQGAGLPKVIPILSTRPRGTLPGKKFCDDTLTSPEVIGAHTPNFKPNYKFSRLHFFGGTSVPVWVCASKASSISSACKNFRAHHPIMAEI